MAGLFCESFRCEDVPNDEFIRKWLIDYYDEMNRLKNVWINNEDFDRLIDIEFKKVLINMQLVRLFLIERSIFFAFILPDRISLEQTKNYALSIYIDYKANEKRTFDLLEHFKTNQDHF